MPSLFSTTQWSLVLAAGDSHNPKSRQALATLCQSYWYPVYVLVLHSGNDPESARDLTQGFFAHLMEKQSFKVVTPDRGRFRGFLRIALHNYLANERERERARKRGGGRMPVSLHFDDEHTPAVMEPTAGETPQTLYEKNWARTLLASVLERLRREMDSSRDAERYRRLEPFLTGAPPRGSYAEIAKELEMTEGAIKTSMHRLRKRYGILLREEVSATVQDPAEVDEEIRYLFSVIRRQAQPL
jgi:RNA polymerase sigma-70 factor (ECF subfamily)